MKNVYLNRGDRSEDLNQGRDHSAAALLIDPF